MLGKVETKAAELLKQELEQYKTAVRKLPDVRRDAHRKHRKIRRQAATPEPEDWELPEKIQASREGKAWERHLYVRANGKKDSFPAKLNAWETDVMIEELARKGIVGWLRNDPRKDWSFTVPYKVSAYRPMYPDFLVFRKQDDGILCDILEPHSLSFDDSAAKAQGLAEFAKQHGDNFGRIELIAKIGKGLKRLALNDPETRDKVLGVSDNEHLRQLFEDAQTRR